MQVIREVPRPTKCTSTQTESHRPARVASRAAMSRSVSYPVLLGLCVSSGALTLIAWPRIQEAQLISDDARWEEERLRAEEAAWQAHRVPITVRVDAALPQHAHSVVESRTRGPTGNSEWDKRLVRAKITDDGSLEIISGTCDGFVGEEVRICFHAESDGHISGDAAPKSFWDFGPPFDEFWSNVKGSAILRSSVWKHGDTVFVDYDVNGDFRDELYVVHGRLRVEVP
jgi:hypothetical protein